MVSASFTLLSRKMISGIPIRNAYSDDCGPVYGIGVAKCAPVRMKWVAVTDENANQRPQMSWGSN